MDWKAWHEKYDDPASPMTRRLRIVQGLVREALDKSPPGQLRVISLCAGQGRDLLEVLADHPRREDVHVRLVELDERNCELAKAAAEESGLSQVEVVTADASRSENYDGMTPADLVLICGLFGNISDADIERVVATCPQLCSTGGRVIWTRNRRAPDRVGRICVWFEERRFEREWLSDEASEFGVGMHRFAGTPEPLALGRSLFSFVGYDRLPDEADASGASGPRRFGPIACLRVDFGRRRADRKRTPRTAAKGGMWSLADIPKRVGGMRGAMRIGWAAALVAGLSSFGVSTAQTAPQEGKLIAPASVYRTAFHKAFIKRCSADLTRAGAPRAEIAMACPCMADHVLAATPDDAKLANAPERVMDEAVAICAAKADDQFGSRR